MADYLGRRSQRFNDTTGVVGYWTKHGATSANCHPDRCVCQEMETGRYAGTPHKHHNKPPYGCARCGPECAGYQPALPETLDELAGQIERAEAALTVERAEHAETEGKWMAAEQELAEARSLAWDTAAVLCGTRYEHDDHYEYCHAELRLADTALIVEQAAHAETKARLAGRELEWTQIHTSCHEERDRLTVALAKETTRADLNRIMGTENLKLRQEAEDRAACAEVEHDGIRVALDEVGIAPEEMALQTAKDAVAGLRLVGDYESRLAAGTQLANAIALALSHARTEAAEGMRERAIREIEMCLCASACDHYECESKRNTVARIRAAREE